MHIWMNACNAYMHATTKHEQNEKNKKKNLKDCIENQTTNTKRNKEKHKKRKQQHNNTSGVQGQHTYKRATHSYTHRFL